MDSVLKFPIDLMQLPPSRRLKELTGSEERTLMVWFVLFQELHYRMQDGGLPGRITKADFDRNVIDVLAPMVEGAKLLSTLKESRLLVEDGDEYFCARFAVNHGGESPSGRSLAQRGGDMRAFSMKMKKLEQGGVFQQSLHIAEAKLVDEDGHALDHDTVKRVTRLIVTCDNALFKSERPPMLYTEGLIHEALRVLAKHADEEIDYVLRTVAKNRNHPALSGMTAEKLLPRFDEIARNLAGEAVVR